MRSPTMVSWPGTITPGVSDFAWAFWDFMPTVAELAGATGYIPKDIDGISIVPTLMGKTQPDKEYLYWTWKGTGCGTRSASNPQGTCKPKGPDDQVKGNPAVFLLRNFPPDLKPDRPRTAKGSFEKCKVLLGFLSPGAGLSVGV